VIRLETLLLVDIFSSAWCLHLVLILCPCVLKIVVYLTPSNVNHMYEYFFYIAFRKMTSRFWLYLVESSMRHVTLSQLLF